MGRTSHHLWHSIITEERITQECQYQEVKITGPKLKSVLHTKVTVMTVMMNYYYIVLKMFMLFKWLHIHVCFYEYRYQRL